MGNSSKYYVIVVAGGSSTRFAANKLLCEIAGETVLARSLSACARSSADGIVLVARHDLLDQYASIAATCCGTKLIATVAGGATRTDSVRAGLNALQGIARDEEIVLTHDAARPLAPPHLFGECARLAQEFGGAIVALPVIDTVKLVEGAFVVQTPAREKLWAAQTPQGFSFANFLRITKTELSYTDDAAAAEACGLPVAVVTGVRCNIKITSTEDIAIAEALMLCYTENGI